MSVLSSCKVSIWCFSYTHSFSHSFPLLFLNKCIIQYNAILTIIASCLTQRPNFCVQFEFLVKGKNFIWLILPTSQRKKSSTQIGSCLFPIFLDGVRIAKGALAYIVIWAHDSSLQISLTNEMIARYILVGNDLEWLLTHEKYLEIYMYIFKKHQFQCGHKTNWMNKL